MPHNVHLEMVSAEVERRFEPSREMATNEVELRSNAAELAHNLSWLPSESRSRIFLERCRDLSKALKPVLRALEAPSPGIAISDDSRWLYDNPRLLISELEDAGQTFRLRRKIPHVRTQGGAIIPRVAALAEAFLAGTEYQFSQATFISYVEAFQQHTVLKTK
jgi:hypothetical protein